MKFPVVLVPAFVLFLAACSANQPTSSSNSPDLSRQQLIEKAGAPLARKGDFEGAKAEQAALAEKKTR